MNCTEEMGALDAGGRPITQGKITSVLLKLTAYFHFQNAVKTKTTCERVWPLGLVEEGPVWSILSKGTLVFTRQISQFLWQACSTWDELIKTLYYKPQVRGAIFHCSNTENRQTSYGKVSHILCSTFCSFCYNKQECLFSENISIQL